MELINNIENKAKFFALYWGQKILRCTATDGCGLEPFEVRLNERSLIFDYLELTPLSQITDEDALKLSEEVYQSIDEYGFNFYYGGYKSLTSEDVDFLRSKGYALPWMGLSVEQLVSFGWVKLKER